MDKDINVAVGGPVNADYPKVYKTKFLKPGIPFGLQVTDTDTKYVIKHNFNLGGESVTIQERCILEFDGGSISNGTLVGQSTCINSDLVKIFFGNILLKGSWRVSETYPEWFGAVGNGVVDDITAINLAASFASNNSSILKLTKYYYISDDIVIPSKTNIIGSSNTRIKVGKNFIIQNECCLSNVEFIATDTTEALIRIDREVNEESPNNYLLNVRIANIILKGRTKAKKTGLYGIEIHAIDKAISEIFIDKVYTYNSFDKGLYLNTNRFITCGYFSNMFLNNCNIAIDLDGGEAVGTNGIGSCVFTNIYGEGNYKNCQYYCRLKNSSIIQFINPQYGDLLNYGPNGEIVDAIFYLADDRVKIDCVNAYLAGSSNSGQIFKKYDGTSGLDVITNHVNLIGGGVPTISLMGSTAQMNQKHPNFTNELSVQLNGTGSNNNPAVILVGKSYLLSNAMTAKLAEAGEDSYRFLFGVDLVNKTVSLWKRGDTSNSWEEVGETKVSYGSWGSQPDGINGLVTYRTSINKLLVYATNRYRDCLGYTATSKRKGYKDFNAVISTLEATGDIGLFVNVDGTNHGYKPVWFNGSKFTDAYGFTASEKKASTTYRNDMLKEPADNTSKNLYPSLDNNDVGYELFDITLGRPLWMKTITENDTTTKLWVDSDGFKAARKVGTTSQRPTSTLTVNDAGFQYFDTTLGKPIWLVVNGTTKSWVDATGATV